MVSFVAERRLLSSYGAWAPKCLGPVVAACRLSCPHGMWGIVPTPGIEPMSPALESGFLTTGLPGKSPTFVIYVTHRPMKLAGHSYYHHSTGKEMHT